MKARWALARLALAATPLLSLQLWAPSIGGWIRATLWLLATATPFYLARWPKVVDRDGDGIAGVWGLKATCRCYSRPPAPMFPSRGVVCVSNEGYETKVCAYNTYLIRPPLVEEELPPGGEPCKPGFTAGRPAPPTVFRRPEGRAEVVAVAWDEGGASAYMRGRRHYRIPKTLRPPRQENPYVDYMAHVDYYSAARELAYTLLEKAKPSPTQGVRLGVDEHGREYRIPLGHIGVFGSTGCGKSSTLALLARRLAEAGFRVWIVDPYGEYSALEGFETLYSVPSPFEDKMPEEMVELLEDASIITFGAQRGAYSPIVYQVVKKAVADADNLEEAVRRLWEQLSQAQRWDVEQAVAAALRRLEPLTGVRWLGRRELPDRVVFDISTLPGMAKVLAVNSVLEKAWLRGETIVIVDEAGSLARSVGAGEYITLPALRKVVMLGRARKVFIIVADQYADRLPYALLAQLHKVWMRHMPPPPLSAPEDIRDVLARLRTGEVVVDGVLVKIDPPPRLGEKLTGILEKVALEELESLTAGHAPYEVAQKLWGLGLARGRRLTEKGRRVYNMLKKARRGRA